MRLRNILLVVRDIEKSKQFYQDLFGMVITADFGGNVMLSAGLVLQEQKIWEQAIGSQVVYGKGDGELYFEEEDLDGFLELLEKHGIDREQDYDFYQRDWGQRLVRLRDPDGHLIEVAESERAVVRRMKRDGMSINEIGEKTHMLLEKIQGIVGEEEVHG